MTTRYLLRPIVVLLIALLPAVCFATVQINDSAPPSMGDIIEYDDTADGVVYGLVMEVSPVILTVERQKRSRGRRGAAGTVEFDTDRVPWKSKEWAVIDSMAQRVADRKSEYRIWKAKGGKSTIEASLVKVEGANVRLKKKSNGKTISIPVSKLSDADQEFLKGSDEEDLFSVEEEEDYPDEVLVLIERRKMYMDIQTRHKRLARTNKNMLIGDIIFCDRFASGNGLAIVTSLDFGGKVESVDKDGELDDHSSTVHGNWWFYDRPMRPLKSRTWSSSGGSFKIKATLVEVTEDEEVVLRKEDGGTMTVPLSKLGDKDNSYVKKNRGQLNKANQSQSEIPDEFADEMQILLVRRAELIEFYEASTVAAKDAAKMKSISLNTRAPKMEASQLQPLTLRNDSFNVSVGIKLAQHARIERVSYSEDAGLAAFVASSPFHGAPVLAVVDVNTSEAVVNEDSEQVGDDAEVLTVSPSGRTILVYSEDGFDKQQLEYWSFVDGTLKRVAIVPYKTFHTPKAHMFTDDKGCILNFHGDLVFFDLTERIKPTDIVQGSRMTHGTTMQISDDQNFVFYFAQQGNALHFVDVAKKKCAGGLKFNTGQLAGSPYAQVNSDGETATFLHGRQLAIYDINSGEIIKEHEMPSHFNRAFFEDDAFPMLTENLVQTFNNKIFDLKLSAEIGKIAGHSHGVQHFSNSSRIVGKVDDDFGSRGRGGFSSGRRGDRGDDGSGMGHGTVNIKYESLDIAAIEAFANSLSEKDIVTFGEGDKLELDLDLGDANATRRLEDKLNDEMADGGIKMGRGGDFVLKAVFKVGQPKTETFRIIGRFGQQESTRTVTVTPKTCKAELLYRGTVVWSRSDSVQLGRPWSVEDLNQRIKKSKSLNASRLLEFSYPVDLRVLHPEKVRTFNWE